MNFASARPHASEIGMTSKTASRRTLVGMIEREAIGHAAAAVVPDEIESRVPKLFHHRDEFVRHGSLRIGVMILGGGWRAAAAIAAKIDTDHRMVACEPRRQMAPHQAGSGKPMHQEERRSLSVAPDENGVVAGVDLGCLKVTSAGGAWAGRYCGWQRGGAKRAPDRARFDFYRGCHLVVLLQGCGSIRAFSGSTFRRPGWFGYSRRGAPAPKTCFAWMNGSRTPRPADRPIEQYRRGETVHPRQKLRRSR